MTEEKKEVSEGQKEEEKKKKKTEEPLPFCRTAPSAEHSRPHEDDDPCDDSRGSE
jgi:hypothetical protein